MHERLVSRRLFTASLSTLALGGCRTAEPPPLDASVPRSAPSPAPLGRPPAPPPLVCAPTTEDIEGPYFKAGAPVRTRLAGQGTPLELVGRLLGPDCQPLAGELELWHADHRGDYDLAGFGFRARVPIDASGGFQVRTIVPGRYLNGRTYRPAHLHLKLHAPGRASRTTQLYFEGDPFNAGDPWVHASRIATPEPTRDGLRIIRDFVLA